MKCHYTFKLLWNFSVIERGKEWDRDTERDNLWNMLTIETICQYKSICYTIFLLFLYTWFLPIKHWKAKKQQQKISCMFTYISSLFFSLFFSSIPVTSEWKANSFFSLNSLLYYSALLHILLIFRNIISKYLLTIIFFLSHDHVKWHCLNFYFFLTF